MNRAERRRMQRETSAAVDDMSNDDLLGVATAALEELTIRLGQSGEPPEAKDLALLLRFRDEGNVIDLYTEPPGSGVLDAAEAVLRDAGGWNVKAKQQP